MLNLFDKHFEAKITKTRDTHLLIILFI